MRHFDIPLESILPTNILAYFKREVKKIVSSKEDDHAQTD